MNLKPGCRPKHGVCARFAPSAVRLREFGLGRRGGGGGQGQPQRARVLCGLSEGYEQTMTTGFTCAPDRRARRCACCSNSTGFLFWWLHHDVGAKAGEGWCRVREGRTKWPLTALGTATGSERWRWDKDQNLTEGAAWGCGSTVSPLLRSKCGPAVTPLVTVTAADMTSIMDDDERDETSAGRGPPEKGFQNVCGSHVTGWLVPTVQNSDSLKLMCLA